MAPPPVGAGLAFLAQDSGLARAPRGLEESPECRGRGCRGRGCGGRERGGAWQPRAGGMTAGCMVHQRRSRRRDGLGHGFGLWARGGGCEGSTRNMGVEAPIAFRPLWFQVLYALERGGEGGMGQGWGAWGWTSKGRTPLHDRNCFSSVSVPARGLKASCPIPHVPSHHASSLIPQAATPSTQCSTALIPRAFLKRKEKKGPTDHQPPTTNRHQPPTATNHRQRRPTANRQPLPTAINRQSPTTNCRQPPPTTTNRQSPTANHQPPIATNHG